MRTGRRILKNMLSLTVAEIMSKGINFLTVAYLARVIAPEGYGILGIVNSYIVYFVFIANLGFDTLGTREVSGNKSQLTRYVNSILTIRFILGLISFSLLILFLSFLRQPLEIKILWAIAGINIFTNSFLLNWVFQALEKMEIIAIRQVITGALNLAGVIIFVHNPDDLLIAMIITVSSLALNTGWMLIYYMKSFGIIKPDYDFRFWLQLIKPSMLIGMSFFIVIIYNNLNVNILGFIRPEAESGFYVAAYKVLAIVILPTGIYQQAFFPNISRLINPDDRIRIMDSFTRLMYLSGTFISSGVFIFSDSIIRVIYGENYSESGLILKILMITAFIQYVNISFSAPLFAWKKEKNVFYSTAFGGAVNIIANIFLIPKYGGIGAAIATIFSELAVYIGLAFSFYKTLHRLFLNNLVKITAISLISSGAAYLLLHYGFGSVVSAIVCLGIFILIILLFRIITIKEIRLYFEK